MKLDVNDPDVFDKWREQYYSMTTEEQKEFYAELEKKFPHQKSFHTDNFDEFFINKENIYVLEVGGWKGELAKYCIENHDIKSWLNIELCKEAVQKSVIRNDIYDTVVPDNYDWFNNDRQWDISAFTHFVSSHMIEHITDEQLKGLLAYINGIKNICIEAPIEMDENDWEGEYATHILKMGWVEICSIMMWYGYKVKCVNKHCFIFTLEEK